MTRSEQLQEFFFLAAANTYLNEGVHKTTIAKLPGSKVLRYERGSLLYVDTYFTNGKYSGGQTTIFDKRQPVWLMQYHGLEPRFPINISTIAFLKRVLKKAYDEKLWLGGRGPSMVMESFDETNQFVYQNKPKQNNFEEFFGIENIYILPKSLDVCPDCTVVAEPYFWHRYQGYALYSEEE